MNKWNKGNNNGRFGRPNDRFNKPQGPRVNGGKPRSISKVQALYNQHRDDLGEGYHLNDIVEVGYPFTETAIEVITSGKPSDILQDLHILLIELVVAGVNTKEMLSQFLGVALNDFILDELYPLLENGILANNDDGSLRVTTKGDLFLSEHKFIPVTAEEEFKFYIDGVNQQLFSELPSEISNTPNRIKSKSGIDYEFVRKSWFRINEIFSKVTNEDKEIVDLANYKRSIVYKRDVFVKMYVLIYVPSSGSRKVQMKVYDHESRHLKEHSQIISNFHLSNPDLFDFGEDAREILPYAKAFKVEAAQVKSDKVASGRYQDLSTFEHKELIKEALFTAEFAVYIESPWIRKATRDYLQGMEVLLRKKRTKLFIAYGIDGTPRNAPHPDVFREIQRLQKQFPDRVFVIDLPAHFSRHFPNRDGSHRKILIKDFEYYVKGSYNWLSYNGDETQNYAVEEGTQFFDNVKAFWIKVFKEYQLDLKLLDFIDSPVGK